MDDNATCVVASNLQIHYNWTLQHNIYSPNRTIYFQKPGFYVCSVKYNIRNITCNATIVDVNVSRIVDGKETVAKSFDITVEQSKSSLIYVLINILYNTNRRISYDFNNSEPSFNHRFISLYK